MNWYNTKDSSRAIDFIFDKQEENENKIFENKEMILGLQKQNRYLKISLEVLVIFNITLILI